MPETSAIAKRPARAAAPLPLAALLGLLVAASGLMLVATGAAIAAPDQARGEEIVQGKCFICHGASGESASPAFARLAGQNASYLARQLGDFQSGKRKSSTMQPMVEDLSPDDFKALGAFFASRPAVVQAIDDAGLAQKGQLIFQRGKPDAGVASCASCHGANAHGTESLPRLAGQLAQYTENQLKQFSKRERTNDNAVMHGMAGKLTELELKAVAAYLSALP